MSSSKKLKSILKVDQEKEILDKLKKGITGVKKEITEECQHDNLKKIIRGDLWYQCKKCKMVFFLPLVPAWDKKQIPLLIDALEKGLDLKK